LGGIFLTHKNNTLTALQNLKNLSIQLVVNEEIVVYLRSWVRF